MFSKRYPKNEPLQKQYDKDVRNAKLVKLFEKLERLKTGEIFNQPLEEGKQASIQ